MFILRRHGLCLGQALILMLAIVLPRMIAADASTQDLMHRLEPPFGEQGLLGTDSLGRNVFARIFVATGNSLEISLIGAAGSSMIGVLAGIVAGWRGGLIDQAIETLVDTMLAIPFVTIGLVVTATLGQSNRNLIILLIVSGWITQERIVRSQVQSVASAGYIEAALANGGSTFHVISRHLVPNIIPLTSTVFFQLISTMLLWSATLTFLGIGGSATELSLGSLIRDGQNVLFSGWWVSAFSGAVLIALVLVLNAFADSVRSLIDPLERR